LRTGVTRASDTDHSDASSTRVTPVRLGLKNAVMDLETLRPWIAAEIDRNAAELDQMGNVLMAGPLAPDLRDELTLLARYVLQVHDRQMPLVIALQRGGEATADLAMQAREEVVNRGHRYAVAWLQEKIAEHDADGYDAEAVAVVALGSLLAYAAQRVTFGGTPLDVDEDRFVATWVEVWLRVAQSVDVEVAT
jgi:hypothetical protein